MCRAMFSHDGESKCAEKRKGWSGGVDEDSSDLSVVSQMDGPRAGKSSLFAPFDVGPVAVVAVFQRAAACPLPAGMDPLVQPQDCS